MNEKERAAESRQIAVCYVRVATAKQLSPRHDLGRQFQGLLGFMPQTGHWLGKSDEEEEVE